MTARAFPRQVQNLVTYSSLDDTITHNIYCSPSGTGTGTTVGDPTDLQSGLNSLVNGGPYLAGLWQVNVAVGTYVSSGVGFTTPDGLGARQRIRIVGPDVGGHPNVPTAIIDAAGKAYGLNIQTNTYAKVQDVKVTGTSTSGGGGTTAASFVALVGANVWWKNCHSHGNSAYIGIFSQSASRAYIEGGIIDGTHNYGITLYGGTVGTVGYHAVDTTGAPQISGCTVAGLNLQGKSYADCFYTTFDSNGRGALIQISSRARFRSCVITNNTIAGVDCRQGSHINLTSVTDATKLNTLSGNALDVALSGNSTEFLVDGKASSVHDACLYRGVATLTLTGTTTATNMSGPDNFNTIPPAWLKYGGRFRVRAVGSFTGTAGSKTLGFRLGTSVMTSAASSSAGTYIFEAEAFFTGTGTVVSNARLIVNGQAAVLDVQTKSLAVDGTLSLRLYGTLGDTGDTITINSLELFLSPPKLPVVVGDDDAL